MGRLAKHVAVLGLGLVALTANHAAAQRPDTTRSVVDTVGPRAERQPPLSPRRAFAYSLVLPGYAQSRLNRSRAGTLFTAFEAVALVMVRQSAADIREARRNVADSIVVSFVDANGNPGIKYQRTPFSHSLIRSRRSHLEDWTAVLIANHLFAAADAYVASLLWDLPAEIGLRPDNRSVSLAFNVRW